MLGLVPLFFPVKWGILEGVKAEEESTDRRNLVGAFKGKTFVLYYICHNISCDRCGKSADKMLALKQTIKDISKVKKLHS